MKTHAPKWSLSSTKLILLSAVFLMAFANMAFFANVLKIYPYNLKNIGFLFSLFWVFSGFIVIFLALICWKYTIKGLLITLFLASSFASYFMDSYNTILDDAMIQNIAQTNMSESLELVSFKLLGYVLLLGLFPSVLVYRSNIVFGTGWQEFISRLKLFFLTLISVLAVALVFGDFYSSFFREHKPLRYYSNPGYYLYSGIKYVGRFMKSKSRPLQKIGLDAKKAVAGRRNRLVIFVVGESARADRFSLNGYERATNAFLKKERVFSFTNYWACGTSTAISVPCMFSIYDQSEFDNEKGRSTENVLDILKHAGIEVLWLDNNSDSKGVAERLPYQNFRNADLNPLCDLECRDEGMLTNLQTYIDAHRKNDLLIVLHQMGNHGPAYYKRYPPEFERFRPVCKTNQLEDCSKEALNNAYDNAILYTDFFLSKTIAVLKENEKAFETALFYVSDHGESLGENGLYLHGLPNFIAPEAQRRVPVVLWFGQGFGGVNLKSLEKNRERKYSHDNVFHTILGLMSIETKVYDEKLDMLKPRK